MSNEKVSVEQKQYECFFFRQRKDSPVQCSFVSTTADISDWSSVPQKANDDLRNFQRPEMPDHVNEISEFFKNFEANSSPSAIVLGFKRPMECFTRKLEKLDLSSIPSGEIVPGYIQIPMLNIEPVDTIEDKRLVLKELIQMLKSQDEKEALAP
ncbi:hypothetical protein [Paraburkholderia domus]|uniref:Uncharacterized protein n=1 Tax=Paraburkholderia domus TaxID=2793075 RepID=A0A9N8MRW9_9BURK|nr:hypothetical protein [Paraburkholderia domus]MBK5163805.1 hypothetical protein [Burkholderia sp. R-70211]CAE6858381.1 hypothetical protein R70211_00307 [Paraburkholderia domus]